MTTVETRGPALAGSTPALSRVIGILQRYALPIAILLAVALFGSLRPDAFLTWRNATAVLTLAAPMLVAALGLTVVLAMGEIDLSLGSAIGLGGALAVCAMSFFGTPWPVAIVLGLAAGAAAGLLTGAMVVRLGANSLIITLGMASVLTGVEFLMTDQRTIYTGIAQGYIALGQSEVLGLNLQVWIAGLIAICVHALLWHTEWGRGMYAAGENPEAAILAGLPVSALRIAGFVIAGLGAAIAGILLTAQTASAFSNAGQAFLLPAYAAAFLGSTASSDGRFTAFGTVLAVFFIGIVQTGLTMVQLSTGAISLVQGALLIGAVLLSRLGRKERR
ncbi:hypothetical protein B7H23_04150 [Notoacmeibacter marinus]|uniref:ABC transporter permease n=1 Tax=Notoacmeibacter marinus TaxID=1876515 RepID=A0A231V1S2_9HYPH|nr:ABC transporter permease [Notoacmeibacter marinus]OXT02122.1 hypothetical protein B7H23_04150 [Notoacmeibacter marinus]